MTKYYINGKQVTNEEAEKQDKINKEIMEIKDNEEWLRAMQKAEFIVKIGA